MSFFRLESLQTARGIFNPHIALFRYELKVYIYEHYWKAESQIGLIKLYIVYEA